MKQQAPSALLLLIAICCIVLTSASLTIKTDPIDSLFENTPVIFTIETTTTLEAGQTIPFTSTTQYSTPSECLWFSAPTPYDLIRDPSDSSRGFGNCFPTDSTTIAGDDAIALLEQFPIDCTTTDPKPLLTLTTTKEIRSGTKFRCLGKILSAPLIDATRQISLSSTELTQQLELTIKPFKNDIKIEFLQDFAQIENERYVLAKLTITPSSDRLSLPQVLPLSAHASFTTISDSTTIKSKNLFFNAATFGDYPTTAESPWNFRCFSGDSQQPAGRLFVSIHQDGPTFQSSIPSALNFTQQEQTTLIMSPIQKSITCTFPLSITQPQDTVKTTNTPITISLGPNQVETLLPYRLLLPSSSSTTTPIDDTKPITQIRVYSHTDHVISNNNASVSYVFKLNVDFPQYSQSFMDNNVHPKVKYELVPTKTYGENTSLDQALDLLFPDGESTVIWSVLTPTTTYCKFEYDKVNQVFLIEYTSDQYPTQSDQFSFQVRFSTVSFSPPINANSRQTNFDLAFNLVEIDPVSSTPINNEDDNQQQELLFRIRPALLLDRYSIQARREWGDIRFTARFRALGFPGTQSGVVDWSTANEQTYPSLHCWLELNDDILPPTDAKKGVSMSISVSGQPDSTSSSSAQNNNNFYRAKNFWFLQTSKKHFGGKLQYTSLDVRIPVSLYGVFPYKHALAKVGCKFAQSQPVILDFNKFINNDPTLPNLYPLRFEMDETSSYVTEYTPSADPLVTDPIKFTAATTPLMLRVTSTKEIQTQYDLEITQSAVFDLLKNKLRTANEIYKQVFNNLDFFKFRYYVPYSTNFRLNNQGLLFDLNNNRYTQTTQYESSLLPLTNAFTGVSRFHSFKTTSLSKTGLDDAGIYTVATANDISSTHIGSLFHVLIDPTHLSQYIPLSNLQEYHTMVNSITIPSISLDWNKNTIRVEVLPYRQNDKLGVDINGYPYQPDCPVMRITKAFNSLGYKYPGQNPVCGGRQVGQKCLNNVSCNGGYCSPRTQTCVRDFDSIGLIANSTYHSYDLMDSILSTSPQSHRFTSNKSSSAFSTLFIISIIAITFALTV
jgi:hypothetical protein